MEQAGLSARGQLRRSSLILAVVAASAWCTSQAATEEEAAGRHDHVRISGSPEHSVKAGSAFAFKPVASDSDHRTLHFAIEHKPSWASFDTKTGELSGKPSEAQVGRYADIVIGTSDGWRSARLPAFTLEVLADASVKKPAPTPTPAPPTPAPAPKPVAGPSIAGSPATADVAGSPYSFKPTATGPSGDTLSFSVQNKPAWATFSIATGLLSGTPASTQTGTYADIVVSVSDGKASAALPAFSIIVKAPTAPSQPQPASGSAVVNWTAPTHNTDGTPLTGLAGIRIFYGTTAANLTHSVQLAATQTSATIANLASGTWYFAGAVYTASGTQSALSSVVSASVP